MSLVNGRVRRGVGLGGFVVACLGVVGGCGGKGASSAEPPAAGAGGSAGGAEDNGAGTSAASTAGGAEGSDAGAPTNGGAEGEAGSSSGGAAGVTVPRIENTDGESVLVTPEASLGDGVCQGSAVHCNGICLTEEQQAARNCTLLKLGLGQTGSLALSSQALFYTAANREIIKLDLASGEHTSLVRGLSFVDALQLQGDELYFSTELPELGDDSEVRRVGVAGGDVTVLSPPQPTSIPAIVPLVDRLVFQVGAQYGGGELFAIPKAGGAATSFGSIDEASLPVLSGSTLYYLSNGKLHGTNVDAPAAGQALSTVIGDGLMFVVDGEFIYDIEQGKYSRTPITGGARQPVQVLDSPSKLVTYLVGRTPTHVVLRRYHAGQPTITQLLTMPIDGNGTPTELATIEQAELQAVVGDANHIYLAVGAFKAGGLLRVAL